MNQGDIYLVNLDPTVQTEIGKTRPGLIISVNAMNHSSPRLIVAPITSSTGKVYPFEMFIRFATAITFLIFHFRPTHPQSSVLRPPSSPLRFLCYLL
jgi:hypothetical protein